MIIINHFDNIYNLINVSNCLSFERYCLIIIFNNDYFLSIILHHSPFYFIIPILILCILFAYVCILFSIFPAILILPPFNPHLSHVFISTFHLCIQQLNATADRLQNKDYEYFLWTDEKMLELLTKHYSWFLPTYHSYRFPIQVFFYSSLSI